MTLQEIAKQGLEASKDSVRFRMWSDYDTEAEAVKARDTARRRDDESRWQVIK
jgi:hypothetical protein